MLLFFYMLLFFEPSLEPLGKLGFSTILDDSSSSWRERVSGHYNGRKVKGHWIWAPVPTYEALECFLKFPTQAQQRFWLQRARGQCFHISDVNKVSEAQHHSSQYVNTFNHALSAFWNSGTINSYPKSMTIPFIMNKVFINKHISPYFLYLEGKFQQ